MAPYERSINIALDKLTGEILHADEVFNTKKEAFEIRRQYHEKNLLLSCFECEQDLIVSGSKYDRLHFKHKPGHEYCILSDGHLSPEEHEKFTAILKSKETYRHKELKNRIGKSLINIDGVDKDSIAIDNKFIIRGNEKRRPDVYCIYKGNELVFEIQLSDLSLGYILSRYEFYKKHGMYLIWILDNFDIHNQGTLERDIKYLTKYQNYFKLDEEYDDLYLECDYKIPFLTYDNKVQTRWQKTSISLNQLKFDKKDFQAYYYDFYTWKEKIELEQKSKAAEIEEAYRKRTEIEKENNANNKATEIIHEIKRLRNQKSVSFDSVWDLINNLDEYEVKILNQKLGLKDNYKIKELPIHTWLSKADIDDIPFIEFILSCTAIDLNVNIPNKAGKTTFQLILEIKHIVAYKPILALLKRGYILTDSDKEYFFKLKIDNESKNDFYVYDLCSRLTNKNLAFSVFLYRKVLFIIESARKKEIIGFNYKKHEWIGFANNAIQYYSEYWEYIEIAFKGFGLWKLLIEADKKGSFRQKLQDHYYKNVKQKDGIDQVFNDLYPEVYDLYCYAEVNSEI